MLLTAKDNSGHEAFIYSYFLIKILYGQIQTILFLKCTYYLVGGELLPLE